MFLHIGVIAVNCVQLIIDMGPILTIQTFWPYVVLMTYLHSYTKEISSSLLYSRVA